MERVRFGDVVKEVKVNIDRSHNPYESYVAGDHMDSEDLTIRRKGRFATVDVGPAFIRLFKPGQVLYGSRRTYLKKVAVADFEGITANTTFVLETKDENVFLQKLLPFLMLSDSFTEWSVKKSKGSTNPYVLFSDLADYEFNLPSLEEQRKLADLLWSAYDLKESYKRLLAASDEMAKSRFVEMFGDPVMNPHGWNIVSLLDFGECKNGMNYGSNESGISINCLGVSDFQNLSVIRNTEKLPQIHLNTPPRADYLLQDEDIVFVRSNGNKALVGRCVAVYPGNNPTVFSGFCIRFRQQKKVAKTSYLLSVLKSPSVRKQMAGRGANIQNLNQQILASVKIPIPPMELQDEFVSFIEQLDKSKVSLQKSIDNLDSVIKNILTTTFTEETE